MRIDAARSVSGVSRIHGGEIASIHEITFTDDGPALILKVYPDSLGWKMRKEASVIARVEGRLRVQVPRVLLVDDSKTVLGLRYLVMSKLHYWHCYGISTGWKIDRSDVNHHNMARDTQMAAVMDQVFAPTAHAAAPTPVSAQREFSAAK